MKYLPILFFYAFLSAQVPSRYPPPGPPGPDRVYLRIGVYAFTTGERHSRPGVSAAEDLLLDEALGRAGELLGHEAFAFSHGAEWMVISDGDMTRPLDYPNLHVMPEFNRVMFTILYNHVENYLTLKDFKIFDKDKPVLLASIGVADGGASVLGSLKRDDGESTMIVITFQTAANPFPGQSRKARFTVESIGNANHKPH